MRSSAIRNTALVSISCLGLLSVAPSAVAAPAASSGSSAVSRAIASGVITNVAGQADSKGQVYVLAFPDQSSLIGKPAGVPIPLTLVGFARTNARGHYAVNNLSASLMATNGGQGYVNLEVIAVSGGKVAEGNYSATLVGNAWKVEGGSNAEPELSFNFHTRLAASTPAAAATSAAVSSSWPITLTTPSSDLDKLMNMTDDALSARAIPKIIPCVSVPETIHYNIREHFITTETIGGNIPETVIEGTDSSSTATLGIATLADAKWSANGTASITDESADSVSVTYSVSHTIYNRVNYRDYVMTCPSQTQRRPYSFYDLLTSDGKQVSITWEFHCGSHAAGTTWTTENATSATIGGGVTLPVLSVTAQAGFGRSVELDFHFNKAGEICGNSAAGPINSSLLEADPY